MLPPHAPPEYADRNTLWNAAEVIEKQWNSQLARRFVLAIPRELPREQYAHLIRDYCREFLVSKGMIADFDIHDKWGRELSRPYPAKKAALLEAISPKEAALMLAQDFSISYADREPPQAGTPAGKPGAAI